MITAAAKGLGARLKTFAPVKKIRWRKRGRVEIWANHEKIETEVVVNAAGAWAPTIGAMVGVQVPTL